MAGWLHGVFVGDWLFVFPLCGFSLSLFCNLWSCLREAGCRGSRHSLTNALGMQVGSAGLPCAMTERLHHSMSILDIRVDSTAHAHVDR